MVKRIFIKHLKGLMLSALLISSSALADDSVSTVDLWTDSFNVDFSSCVTLEVKGFCEWIKCTWLGCKFKTTTVIQHYTPDVIVSVYDEIGESPYGDSDMFTEIVSYLLGRDTNGGEKTPNRHNETRREASVISRHVDVYGSSAAWGLINLLSQMPMGLSCEPGSTILQPYLVTSSNPYFWYTPYIDTAMNLTEYLKARYVTERREGDQGFIIPTDPLWGYIFPRIGSLVATDHYRASAVFAARAMDIVMNGNSFGLYTDSLDGKKGQYYIPSNSFEEWSEDEGKFQMLIPKRESVCHILGDENQKKKGETDGYSDKRSENGDYAWHYWRRYKCCQKPKGYSFLFKVEW